MSLPEPVLLVAAGGLARETLEAVRAGDSYDPVGFLDDDPQKWGATHSGVKVLGGLDARNEHPDARLVVCAGSGAARERLVRRLPGDEEYASVVHPSVEIPQSCVVRSGSIVLAGCVLTASVTLGRHVVLMPGCVLTHDDEVADFATLCASTTLGGSVSVGARAYLGMGTMVRQGVAVGADAVIGMGAVVLGDVPAGQTWFGVPATRRSARP